MRLGNNERRRNLLTRTQWVNLTKLGVEELITGLKNTSVNTYTDIYTSEENYSPMAMIAHINLCCLGTLTFNPKLLGQSVLNLWQHTYKIWQCRCTHSETKYLDHLESQTFRTTPAFNILKAEKDSISCPEMHNGAVIRIMAGVSMYVKEISSLFCHQDIN